MTTPALTTKQFRKMVREEVAKIPGATVVRSYTDNHQGPNSPRRSTAFMIAGKAINGGRALDAVHTAVFNRILAMQLPHPQGFPTCSRWLRMTQLMIK